MSGARERRRGAEPRAFFLTGLPKSGTTWMMRMLDSAPGVLCRGEGRFASSSLAGVPSLHAALRRGLAPWHRYLAHRKRNWLGLDREIQTRGRQNRLPRAALERSLEEQALALTGLAARHLMRTAAAGRPGTRRVGDKTPVASGAELRALARALPEARLLVLRRDPRDFAVSMLFHHRRALAAGRPDAAIEFLAPSDARRVARRAAGRAGAALASRATLRRLARMWREVDRAAAAIARDEPGRVLVIDYEDLCADPAGELRRALAFLGVRITPARARAIARAHSREALLRGADGALAAHLRSRGPGDWRSWLDRGLAELVRKEAGRPRASAA